VRVFGGCGSFRDGADYDAPMRVRGLPPVEGRRARILVLGTMPGVPSLKALRYYANPRNAFWEASGMGPAIPYATRCRRLAARGIALWDVLATCERKGSADAAIINPRANGFGAFHARHPELRLILFNGKKARALFDRLVPPLDGVRLRTLPSTSPANARRGKVAIWRRALGGWKGGGSGGGGPPPPRSPFSSSDRALSARTGAYRCHTSRPSAASSWL